MGYTDAELARSLGIGSDFGSGGDFGGSLGPESRYSDAYLRDELDNPKKRAPAPDIEELPPEPGFWDSYVSPALHGFGRVAGALYGGLGTSATALEGTLLHGDPLSEFKLPPGPVDPAEAAYQPGDLAAAAGFADPAVEQQTPWGAARDVVSGKLGLGRERTTDPAIEEGLRRANPAAFTGEKVVDLLGELGSQVVLDPVMHGLNAAGGAARAGALAEEALKAKYVPEAVAQALKAAGVTVAPGIIGPEALAALTAAAGRGPGAARAARLAGAAFVPGMAESAVQRLGSAPEAYRQHGALSPEFAEAALGGAIDLGFAGFGGYHALRGGPHLSDAERAAFDEPVAGQFDELPPPPPAWQGAVPPPPGTPGREAIDTADPLRAWQGPPVPPPEPAPGSPGFDAYAASRQQAHDEALARGLSEAQAWEAAVNTPPVRDTGQPDIWPGPPPEPPPALVPDERSAMMQGAAEQDLLDRVTADRAARDQRQARVNEVRSRVALEDLQRGQQPAATPPPDLEQLLAQEIPPPPDPAADLERTKEEYVALRDARFDEGVTSFGEDAFDENGDVIPHLTAAKAKAARDRWLAAREAAAAQEIPPPVTPPIEAAPAPTRPAQRRGPLPAPAVDEQGVRILPGEEHLPAADRNAIDRASAEAVRDLARAHAEERQAIQAMRERIVAAAGQRRQGQPEADWLRGGAESVAYDLQSGGRIDPADERRIEQAIGGRFRGRDYKAGTPLEGLPYSVQEMDAALKRDKGNKIEMEIREAARASLEDPERQALQDEGGDASFGPDDVSLARRPQRPPAGPGLFDQPEARTPEPPRREEQAGEALPTTIERTAGGAQWTLVGALDTTTPQRPREGFHGAPLFRQDAAAEERRVERSQGGLFDEDPALQERPGGGAREPGGAEDRRDIRKALRAARRTMQVLDESDADVPPKMPLLSNRDMEDDGAVSEYMNKVQAYDLASKEGVEGRKLGKLTKEPLRSRLRDAAAQADQVDVAAEDGGPEQLLLSAPDAELALLEHNDLSELSDEARRKIAPEAEWERYFEASAAEEGGLKEDDLLEEAQSRLGEVEDLVDERDELRKSIQDEAALGERGDPENIDALKADLAATMDALGADTPASAKQRVAEAERALARAVSEKRAEVKAFEKMAKRKSAEVEKILKARNREVQQAYAKEAAPVNRASERAYPAAEAFSAAVDEAYRGDVAPSRKKIAKLAEQARRLLSEREARDAAGMAFHERAASGFQVVERGGREPRKGMAPYASRAEAETFAERRYGPDWREDAEVVEAARKPGELPSGREFVDEASAVAGAEARTAEIKARVAGAEDRARAPIARGLDVASPDAAHDGPARELAAAVRGPVADAIASAARSLFKRAGQILGRQARFAGLTVDPDILGAMLGDSVRVQIPALLELAEARALKKKVGREKMPWLVARELARGITNTLIHEAGHATKKLHGAEHDEAMRRLYRALAGDTLRSLRGRITTALVSDGSERAPIEAVRKVSRDVLRVGEEGRDARGDYHSAEGREPGGRGSGADRGEPAAAGDRPGARAPGATDREGGGVRPGEAVRAGDRGPAAEVGARPVVRERGAVELPPGVRFVREGEAHKLSSTQVDLPAKLARAVKAASERVRDADLAGKGREEHPHVTVKYGLHTEDVGAVADILRGEAPVRVKLGKVSAFPPSESSEGAAVIKVDVDSRDLHRLNAKIASSTEATDTHPDYKPHVTLAYVKPEAVRRYVGDPRLAGQEATIDRVTFTTKSGKEYEIRLGETSLQERPARPPGTPEPREEPKRSGTSGYYSGRDPAPGTTREAAPAETPKAAARPPVAPGQPGSLPIKPIPPREQATGPRPPLAPGQPGSLSVGSLVDYQPRKGPKVEGGIVVHTADKAGKVKVWLPGGRGSAYLPEELLAAVGHLSTATRRPIARNVSSAEAAKMAARGERYTGPVDTTGKPSRGKANDLPHNLSATNLAPEIKDMLARDWTANREAYEKEKAGRRETHADWVAAGVHLAGVVDDATFEKALRGGAPLSGPGSVQMAKRIQGELQAANFEALRARDAARERVRTTGGPKALEALQEADRALLLATLNRVNFDETYRGARENAARTLAAMAIVGEERGPIERIIRAALAGSC